MLTPFDRHDMFKGEVRPDLDDLGGVRSLAILNGLEQKRRRGCRAGFVLLA